MEQGRLNPEVAFLGLNPPHSTQFPSFPQTTEQALSHPTKNAVGFKIIFDLEEYTIVAFGLTSWATLINCDLSFKPLRVRQTISTICLLFF